MYYRKLNPELKYICQLIVAALDKDTKLLPQAYKNLFSNEPKALEHAILVVTAKPSEANPIRIYGYSNHEYAGLCTGNNTYTLYSFYHKIILEEQQARDVVIGKLNKLPVILNSDFISDKTRV